MSRVHKHNSKGIDGRTYDSHETRVAFLRVAGLLVVRTPSLHFGWALRQLSIETGAPLAKPLSLYFRVM